MRYYTDMNSYQGNKKTAVTLGKFDSLHRGHQKLISRVQELAGEEHIESVVFSFDMQRESLLTNEERRRHLELQVDCMIQCPFTREIREMDAEAFIEEVLIQKLHASCIVVGTDFHFGHGKRGDVHMLAKYAGVYHYRLEVLEKEMYNGREISSTFVKECLEAGEIERANELLGYSYHMTGIVEHGRRLGRTLGFPTMNVAPADRKIMPLFGVYACKVRVEGQWYCGIGNVGIKPTVTEKHRLLTEVFVFGYQGDAYGTEITIEFCAFERPETRFGSVGELKAQVDRDITFGIEYFQKDCAEV